MALFAEGKYPMFEILMLGLGVALFALAGLYVFACERL
jgi:hypothetical protein